MERPSRYRRINITLPADALRLIDRIVSPGDRSRFIAEAVKHYAGTKSRARLRKQLREGAIRHAARDLELAAEWSPQGREIRARRRERR